MINTTQAWKNYFIDSSVITVQCNLTLTNGVSLVLTTDRIMEGTLKIQDEVCDVGEINIGGAVAQEISFDVSNHDGKLSGYDFMGALCVLHLKAGTEDIQKGVYTLYTQNKMGRVISMYGYDHMADKQYNEPMSAMSFNGLTAVQAIKNMGFTLAYENFPNASYVLPNVSTSDMHEGVTKRDVLSYICQLCGCYARYNNIGLLEIRNFGVLSFGDDLDGGTWEFGKNHLLHPYYDTTVVNNGYRLSDVGDGRVQIVGTPSGTSLAIYYLYKNVNAGYEYWNGKEPDKQFHLVDGETYILSGMPTLTNSYICLTTTYYENYTWHYRDYYDTGNGVTFTYHENEPIYSIGIVIDSHAGQVNKLAEPMIRLSTASDEWVTYHTDFFDVDFADGGLFRGAYGKNILPYPYTSSTMVQDGIHWETVSGTDGQVCAYGTATAYTEFTLAQDITFQVGRYKIFGSFGGADDTYKLIVYKKVIIADVLPIEIDYIAIAYCYDGQLYIPYTNLTNTFDVTDPTQEYMITIAVNDGVDMGSNIASGVLFQPMVLAAENGDSDWERYIVAWTAGDAYDGGLFGFWNRSITILTDADASPLSKIMTEPTVSNNRYIVTGVKIIGDNDIEASVGTEDYLIEIDRNPFVTSLAIAEAIASQVYSVLSGVNFYPFSVSWSADPSFEAGDLITFDFLNRTFVTLCTSFNYTLGNVSNISCNDADLNNKVDY